ncbi:hypothetical protein LTR16_002529 [Cryomyces antarcticus]|uniref:Uncharacterized protein n=1 Tax=Cryomyces antarcticus TaxID=329879 RepID=A0ABR0LPH6_9PEZI|nr:hypothetical protein LTR16_002529 [Cryomyces antarcticus]
MARSTSDSQAESRDPPTESESEEDVEELQRESQEHTRLREELFKRQSERVQRRATLNATSIDTPGLTQTQSIGIGRSLGDDDVLDLRALLQYFQNHYPSLRLTEGDLTNCDEALLAYHHTNSTKPVATAFGSLLQAHMRVDPQRLTQITVNHSDNTYSNSSSNVSSNDGDGDSYSNSDSSSDTSLEDGLQEDDALAHSAVDSGDSPNSRDSRRSSMCITEG